MAFAPYFSYFWTNLGPLSLLANFFYFWTNLAPILVEFMVEHIIRPQNSKAGLCHHRSDNDILLPINVGPRI